MLPLTKKPLTRKRESQQCEEAGFPSASIAGVAREVLEALLDQYMNVGIYELEHEAISDNSTIRKIWEDPEDIQVLRRRG